jgi:16S rRNA processing protein RimM
MGQVAAPYGVKGWVRVRSFTEDPEALLDFPEWWLIRAGGKASWILEDGLQHGDGLVAKLAGVPDRNTAESLSGSEVAIPRSIFPPLEENEYYWTDLVGCEVANLRGQSLGRVERLIETGANDVLVLAAERERLLPFIGQVVKRVDLETRRITVDWEADY